MTIIITSYDDETNEQIGSQIVAESKSPQDWEIVASWLVFVTIIYFGIRLFLYV